jgi:DNA repair exonuclease SbcCD ATPase subunit
MEDLMKRLNHIHDECVPEAKRKQEKMDEFTKLKKEISEKIRAVRELLKERDSILESGGNNSRTAEISQTVRTDLKGIKDQVKLLESLQKKEAKKAKKMSTEVREAVSTRAEIVELCYKHIEECEKWEKRVLDKRAQEDRLQLLSGSSNRNDNEYEMKSANDGDNQFSDLVEIDDYTDQLQDLKNRNAEIDKELDEVLKGVGVLKEIALNMDQELETQNQMIDQIEHKVNKSQQKLDSINAKLQKTLDKVMKGDRFLVNFVLICVLLLIVGFIATMFVK